MSRHDASVFLAQNPLAAETLADKIETIEPFAEHHAGGMVVLADYSGVKPGLYVKLHDSWGPEDKVIVHEYDPDDLGVDDVWTFDTGSEAFDFFIRRTS